MWVINCISCIFSIVQVLFPISNYMYSYTVHQFRSPEILPNRSHLKKVGPIHSFEMRNFVDTHWKFDEENPRWSQKNNNTLIETSQVVSFEFWRRFHGPCTRSEFSPPNNHSQIKVEWLMSWLLDCHSFHSCWMAPCKSTADSDDENLTWSSSNQLEQLCGLYSTSNTCWAKNEENQVFVLAGSWPQFFPTIFGVLIGHLLAMRYCWCMFLPVSIHLKNTVKLIHLPIYGLKVNNAW